MSQADHILMNFVTTRWRVHFISHEVLWIDANRDISRLVATVFAFLFNSLWNHVSRAELLMVGPGKLMVEHRS